MKHLLRLRDWSDDEIRGCLDLALDLKRNPMTSRNRLQHRILAMLFQKTSTRTRASFAAGIMQLGGQFFDLSWATSNFSIADIGDEARCLSRYCDVIMARLVKHDDLRALSENSDVPVLNGCCNMYHPCQAMGDYLTLYNLTRDLTSIHMVYVGVANNVLNSLISASLALKSPLTIVTPIVQETAVDAELQKRAKAAGHIRFTKDLDAAVKDATVIYTDTWIDMEHFADKSLAEANEARIKQMLPYQVNAALLHKSSALVMHCMPAHRGYEISEEVLKSPRFIAIDQAENRLHAQKAIMIHCLEA